jgi:hypothetical protein
MKLQQYIQSFHAPLAAEDSYALLRLLALRNKTARGLSDSVGPIDVSRELPLEPLRRRIEADACRREDLRIPHITCLSHGTG